MGREMGGYWKEEKNVFRTFRGKRSIVSKPRGRYYCRHACCVTVSPE